MRMKAAPGALLLIMMLIGCAAPARFNTPAGTPEVVRTDVTGNGEALASADGVRQARTAGLPDSSAAGVAEATMALPAMRLAGANGASASAEALQSTPENAAEETPEELEEYDPWQRFNRKMFWFNRQVDRFVLKPVATVWDKVFPDLVKESFGHALDNVLMPRRLVNNLLQLNGPGAGRELARFFINTTMGVGGFFEAASEVGLDPRDKDTGQTLGVYGIGPGPYLVLPFLPPLTVRDGIGFGLDAALDPLLYVSPFAASTGRTGGTIVDDRALNLERFESVEEATLDLYSAVRNAYLSRRQQAIADAIAETR
jgi:phospholipid-binding lipoprotein MlaA